MTQFQPLFDERSKKTVASRVVEQPIDFGREQRERYKGRNVVERCFNKLKQWRGIAMRSDKTARNYHSALCLAATLQWL